MDNMETNTKTAPHPTPLYWISIGRRLAQSGQWQEVDPEDYGRVFCDDDPPQDWVYAVRLGQIQELEALGRLAADMEPPTVRANMPVRTLRWLLQRLAS